MDAHKLDGAIAGGIAFIDAELARLLSREWEAVGFDPGQSHAGDALFLNGQRANRAGRADLAAIIAGGFATGPVGDDLGGPKTLQSLLETERLQDVVGAALEAFAAANAGLQKLLLGETAGWSDRRRCGRSGAGSNGDGCAGASQQTCEETAPGREAFNRGGGGLQVETVPAVHKFDGLSRAHPSTGLAQSAVRRARGVIRFDGVGRENVDALVAGNTGRLDFPLGGAKEISEREKGAAGANVLAPETPAKDSKKQNDEEQEDRNDVPGIETGIQVPAFGETEFERLNEKEKGAGNDWDGSNKSCEQDAEARGDEASDQKIIFEMHPPAAVLVFEFPAVDSLSDGPIKEIDGRSERADVTAEASRDEDADAQDHGRSRQ